MTAPLPSATLELLDWKPMMKGGLRGFATVRLRNGLSIADVVVQSSHGKSWAALPSKPMLDRNGVAVRDAVTGKIRYASILSWPDKAVADKFSVAVVAAVEAAHPAAVRR